MVEVEFPPELHESVKNYAQKRGLSVTDGYMELVEYALTDIELENDSEDPRAGIL
ncbi:MAG: hypothetical protein ABEK59_05855 [Halobacteria archaeon]